MPAVAELPILTALACLVVALALTVMVVYVVRGFFGVTSNTLGKLPVIGGWIDATGHQIEQRITNALGQVVIKLEAGIGAAWHWQARVVDWIGREIGRHAGLIALIASLLNPLNAIGHIQQVLHEARHLLGALVHKIEGIGHDLGKRIHGVERGIGADVLPRIRGLEHEIDHVVLKDVAALRARTKALERDYERLYRWMRSHPWTIVTSAFVGAVAVALGRLGLGWLRCNSLSRLGKQVGCGGFGALEELLFGAVTALAVTDICDFADIAYGVAEELTPVFMELVDVENALVGCHGATAPPRLRLPTAYLPPVADSLPLAA